MENEPFLPSLKDDKWLHSDMDQPGSKKKDRAWPWKRALTFHLLLAMAYTAITVALLHENAFFVQPIGSSAVMHLPIRTRPQFYMNLDDNTFAGKPNPQIDTAWHGLMENINIRVSEKEVERTNQSSVKLPEGGGNLAWLGVYHELHCLKIIRQWTYRDYYFQNLTTKETEFWELHSDHCIEFLRQAAMCHGDTSISVFEWDATKIKPVLSGRRSPHMCVDWDAIVAFTNDRAVSKGELARLENPLQVNADG